MPTSKIIVTFFAISGCAPQGSSELPPDQYAVPLFHAESEEAHPSCATETVYCNYYFDHKPLFVFKCLNSENQPRLYVSERNSFGEERWYESKLRQDINNQTFSEYCKTTFDNYKWFMQALEKR